VRRAPFVRPCAIVGFDWRRVWQVDLRVATIGRRRQPAGVKVDGRIALPAADHYVERPAANLSYASGRAAGPLRQLPARRWRSHRPLARSERKTEGL